MTRCYLVIVVCVLSIGVQAQAPRTHRLEATPATVAYGHYWSETKPVLTIASGDIIDVDTLLTSVPNRVEKAGVPAAVASASGQRQVDFEAAANVSQDERDDREIEGVERPRGEGRQECFPFLTRNVSIPGHCG